MSKMAKRIIKICLAVALGILLFIGCTSNETVQAEEGDIVVVDFTGYLDGEKFDGGSSTNYYLVLGSNTFVDGFEEGIIGHEAGDSFDIDILFPDDYFSEELAGQTATFSVSLHEIYRSEATDEIESDSDESEEY